MVKHVIFWKLKAEEKANAAAHAKKLQSMFDGLIGNVEGLEQAEVGQNYNGGDFDLCLYTVFSSKEAERAYQTHPLHLEIKAVVAAIKEDRVCVDYER